MQQLRLAGLVLHLLEVQVQQPQIKAVHGDELVATLVSIGN
jgi:hypothetical protein